MTDNGSRNGREVVVGSYCGRKNRRGTPCQRPAGWGTDHPGEGACKLHGGASLRGAAHPAYRHGRYSRYVLDQLGDLVEEFEADDRPLDTADEIAVARALLADWAARHEELVDAVLAWRIAEVRERGALARPARVPDIADMLPMLDTISKMAKRERDTRVRSGISREALARVVTSMRSIVEAVVSDPEEVEAVLSRWKDIRI